MFYLNLPNLTDSLKQRRMNSVKNILGREAGMGKMEDQEKKLKMQLKIPIIFSGPMEPPANKPGILGKKWVKSVIFGQKSYCFGKRLDTFQSPKINHFEKNIKKVAFFGQPAFFFALATIYETISSHVRFISILQRNSIEIEKSRLI